MEKNSSKENLKQKALSSSGWGFLDKGISIFVQFIIGIVLARLLPPSDFGLIGLAMIVVGFGQIFVNLGLGSALIQKQNITERHVRVVFTISVIAGIILALLVLAGAPLAAIVLDNENVTPIIRSLSIIFVIGGFQIPSQALLKKELDFRHIFYVSLAQSILYGVVSTTLALAGFGVWSLVIGTILQRFISLLGSYRYVQHSIKPLIARKELSDLIHFGSGMTLNGIFNYFALQGDYFMVGRLLGANALGLYSKAYSLMQMPTRRFVSVLSNVLFPAASKIQDDPRRLRNVFLKTMRTIAFITIPICLLLIIIAPELIIGLYGEDWRGAITPLQILAGFGVLRAMYNAGGSFLRAKGWVYKLFWANFAYGVIMIIGVWIGVQQYGLAGAAWAVGVAIFVIWYIIMDLNCRTMSIKRVEILKTLVPGLWVGALTALPAALAKGLILLYFPNYLIRLVILVIMGLIFLLLSILLLPQRMLYFMPYELMEATKSYVPIKGQKNYLKLLKFMSPETYKS